MERVIRGVSWFRILDNRSMETAWLAETETGFAITGTIAAAHEEAPLEVAYRLECDPDWRSRSVRIHQKRARDERSLALELDPYGGWQINGVARPDLVGCIDIDLGLSPSTNALPINRLRPEVGQAHEIVAAWVRFPDLDVVAARQQYARLSELEYRYTGIQTGFQAHVIVDRFGLPNTYEGIWVRVAEWPAG